MIPPNANIRYGAPIDKTTAHHSVAQLRAGTKQESEDELFYSENPWENPRHIATTEVRTHCAPNLLGEDSNDKIGLIDIFLTEELPEIELFHGIFDVNSIGLWYYYLVPNEDEEMWRQRIIPWDCIESLTLHPLAQKVALESRI